MLLYNRLKESNFLFKESVSKANFVAFIFNSVDEYPGIYSFTGVKVIKNVVTKINKKENTT